MWKGWGRGAQRQRRRLTNTYNDLSGNANALNYRSKNSLTKRNCNTTQHTERQPNVRRLLCTPTYISTHVGMLAHFGMSVRVSYARLYKLVCVMGYDHRCTQRKTMHVCDWCDHTAHGRVLLPPPYACKTHAHTPSVGMTNASHIDKCKFPF